MGSRLYITNSRKQDTCVACLNVGNDLNLLYKSLLTVIFTYHYEGHITIVVTSGVRVQLHFQVTVRLSVSICPYLDNC